MADKIKICGVPFEIEEVDTIDEECEGVVQGKILCSKAKILIKKSLPRELKKSVLFHELMHGILVMLGYDELSDDETFVQAMSIALYNMFELKPGSIKDDY